MADLVSVPPAWPPHLQDALRGALEIAEGHTQQTIEKALADGLTQLWDAHESFCLTELRKAPNGLLTVHLFLAGGKLEELRPLYPIIEGWAKSQGAVKVTALGRKGWEKSFLTREEGFRASLTYYEKDLGGSDG